ncbi:MAG: hypothetical protein DRG59_03625 [Deltaproteobacteria bacterium]|nr:MAG: hypothetical protein DRG59_03625 [Deltaproteobacteria bacterium]
MSESEKVQMVDIDKILVPEERVTSIVPSDTMQELEQSIKERGIRQPLYIMEINGKLILVDGLHRLVVAKKLGIKQVPAIIRKGTEKDLLIENLILNRQRGISDPIGEAQVLQTLVQEHKMPLSQAAKACNISESTARKYLQILKLPQEILDMVRRKEIGLGCAYWISKLEDREQQYSVARDASVYEYTEEMCRARVLQLLRPNVEPEQTGYTFTPQGAPQKVLPRCFLCGEEIEEDPVYVWLHKSCLSILQDAINVGWEGGIGGSQEIQSQPISQSTPTRQEITTPPTPQQIPQQTPTSEWVWLDECHLVNLRTREIRKVC